MGTLTVSPKVIEKHTELTDKEIATIIDHADNSVTLAKLYNYPITGTIVVAASNSWDLKAADIVCPGADDQLYINAALASLPTSGGRVMLHEGTYVISGSITIAKPNTTLKGLGPSTVIKIKDGLNTDINMIYSHVNHEWQLKNLTLDGNKANQTTGTMHGIYNYTSWRVKIEGCRIKDLRSYGMRLRLSHDVQVRNCFITGCSEGIYYESGERGSFVGNVFKENGQGLYLRLDNFNSLISGNLFYGQTGEGCRVYRGHRTTVTGNTIEANGGTGLYLKEVMEAAATGNAINYNGKHGIYITSASNRLVIAGNAINYNGKHGICGDWVENSLISGNVLVGNSQSANNNYDGILIKSVSTPSTVMGNRVHKGFASNKTRYGISVASGGAGGQVLWCNSLTGAGVSGEIYDPDGGAVVAYPLNKKGDKMEGVLKVVDGSSGSPSIAFSADTDTGIYRAGADHLAIAIGGNKLVGFEPTRTLHKQDFLPTDDNLANLGDPTHRWATGIFGTSLRAPYDQGDYAGDWSGYTPPTVTNGPIRVVFNENPGVLAARLYIGTAGGWKYINQDG